MLSGPEGLLSQADSGRPDAQDWVVEAVFCSVANRQSLGHLLAALMGEEAGRLVAQRMPMVVELESVVEGEAIAGPEGL